MRKPPKSLAILSPLGLLRVPLWDFKVGVDVIGLAEARKRVLRDTSLLDARSMEVPSALRCVLAEDIVAEESVPPFANSAMDGFAVRSVDTAEAPVTLKVVGALMAGGGAFEGKIHTGEALRLMTGAPLPAGADAVCMIERTRDAEPSGECVVITLPVISGENVRRAADDVAAGEMVFPRGTLISPTHIGVLLSAGVSIVNAIPPPQVGVLATGDELVSGPGQLLPGAIRDSNRPALLARLEDDGFHAFDLGTVRDDLAAIAAAIEVGAAKCDAVVTIGGVSVGDRDFLAAALEKLGASSLSSMQIAIKPAKPFAFGVLPPDRRPVFSLPGNPVSALVSYELLVRPALRKMAGHQQLDRPVLGATAADGLRREPDGKTHFVRVRVTTDSNARLVARPVSGQGSHQLRSLADANALAVLPDGYGVDPGDNVKVLILDSDRFSEGSDSTWIP